MFKEFIEDLKDRDILAWVIIIAIIFLCAVAVWPDPVPVSIPDTLSNTGKIENHELAESYRIDCLDGREVMTLYSPSFTQAEFIYTGFCKEDN